MEPVIAPRHRKRINRKTKLNLIFDENARREYLTGFQKRKLQRQKRAEERFKQRLKEERKRIKQEAKLQYKKLVKSFEPIPELEEQLAKEFHLKNTTVSILELDTDLLAERNFIIGRNRAGSAPVKEESDEENSKSDGNDELPGMELKTKKELKKELKKTATRAVKKSKIFSKKNKIEQKKEKKKSMNRKKEIERIKARKKHKGGQDLKKKQHKGKFGAHK